MGGWVAPRAHRVPAACDHLPERVTTAPTGTSPAAAAARASARAICIGSVNGAGIAGRASRSERPVKASCAAELPSPTRIVGTSTCLVLVPTVGTWTLAVVVPTSTCFTLTSNAGACACRVWLSEMTPV